MCLAVGALGASRQAHCCDLLNSSEVACWVATSHTRLHRLHKWHLPRWPAGI